MSRRYCFPAAALAKPQTNRPDRGNDMSGNRTRGTRGNAHHATGGENATGTAPRERWKRLVGGRFSRRAGSYDAHAAFQRHAAVRLAALLPEPLAGRILEIGAGSGLFTRELLARARPDSTLLITDISESMLARARESLPPATNVRFMPLDTEHPAAAISHGPFDLIAGAMTVHWFADPPAGLERLRALLAPGGRLVYSVIGPDFLVEWRRALAECGIEVPAPQTADLPGVVREERLPVSLFDDAPANAGGRKPPFPRGRFLAALRGTGALTPASPHTPLTPRRLRRAVGIFRRRHGGIATAHVLYGCLRAS